MLCLDVMDHFSRLSHFIVCIKKFPLLPIFLYKIRKCWQFRFSFFLSHVTQFYLNYTGIILIGFPTHKSIVFEVRVQVITKSFKYFLTTVAAMRKWKKETASFMQILPALICQEEKWVSLSLATDIVDGDSSSVTSVWLPSYTCLGISVVSDKQTFRNGCFQYLLDLPVFANHHHHHHHHHRYYLLHANALIIATIEKSGKQ